MSASEYKLVPSLWYNCPVSKTCAKNFLLHLHFAFNLAGTSIDNSRNWIEQCMHEYLQKPLGRNAPLKTEQKACQAEFFGTGKQILATFEKDEIKHFEVSHAGL